MFQLQIIEAAKSPRSRTVEQFSKKMGEKNVKKNKLKHAQECVGNAVGDAGGGRGKTREFKSVDIVYTHRVCIEIHSVRAL